jgi:hypothetical protein
MEKLIELKMRLLNIDFFKPSQSVCETLFFELVHKMLFQALESTNRKEANNSNMNNFKYKCLKCLYRTLSITVTFYPQNILAL